MTPTVPKTAVTRSKALLVGAAALAAGVLALAVPAEAQFRHEIGNDLNACRAGGGPAVKVVVSGIRSSRGTLRVQSYHATEQDWMQKGRWLNRIEVPARAGIMTFCMPVPGAGNYGIAVRHDANGNGETDITQDGGGMSNNPGINIFNLGKPSIRRTAFTVGNEVKAITIAMKYM